jgi:hypothetical protein
MPQFIDLTGEKYGRLTVIRRISTTGYGQPKWLCRCACGREAEVFGNALRAGRTHSCGCLQRETATSHGGTGTSEFNVWQMMWQRCTNAKQNSYPRYGGRGIRVCDRWLSFDNFRSDMGPKPTPIHKLERVNNDGDYEPANCRWATPLEQGRNKANNRILEYRGGRRTLMEWCRLLGLKKSTAINRLARGADVATALTPALPRKRRNPR